MERLLRCGFVLAVISSTPGLVPATLHAQATKIFVASTGNDASDGSRGAPKRNFQAAHDAVAAGGQIVVLDTAGYGRLDITKSLAITVPPGVNGFVTVTDNNTNGIRIMASSTAVISLRGLIIEGPGSSTNSVAIYGSPVGNLSIEDCTIRNFGLGVFLFTPNDAKLYVYNTTVRACGIGIDVKTPGTTYSGTINGCWFDQNSVVGLRSESLTGSGTSAVSMTGCVVSGNALGIEASNSTDASVRVSNCSITGNSTGVSISNGGQILSRANNTLENNAAGNTFPSTYSAK